MAAIDSGIRKSEKNNCTTNGNHQTKINFVRRPNDITQNEPQHSNSSSFSQSLTRHNDDKSSRHSQNHTLDCMKAQMKRSRQQQLLLKLKATVLEKIQQLVELVSFLTNR